MPAVTLIQISSVPNFVSREEHTHLAARTPSSFADIPPVLQLQDKVGVTFEPPLDGFSQEDGTEGTLFVIESVLVFMSSTGRGFQIEYPAITLHAITRAGSSPSIYCQLDEIPRNRDMGLNNDGDDMDMRELSIIPQNAVSLEPIFEALSACAALHPDEETASDDDDELDDAFVDMDDSTEGFEPFTGEGDQELSQAGRATLERLDSIICYPEDSTRVARGDAVEDA
ncbi:regulator of volume decrease after cellular swelling-domain-containing protein [Mycena galericulata]|nr:regulator of volume decrease after cellular swelling-domain-containing protein [Mycena galericulata]